MNINHLKLTLLGIIALLAGPAFSAENKLTIGITQYPSTLHPYIDSMTAKSYIHGFTFRGDHRGGAGYDKNWQVVCFLCKEIPSFENGQAVIIDRPHAKEGESKKGVKLTVHYKKDLFWGDGTPITTKDVEFWYKMATSEEVKNSAGLSFAPHIEKLEIVDDYTVNAYIDRISYKYNSSYIPSALPRHLEESIFDADPSQYHARTNYVTNPTNAGLYNGPFYVSNLKQGQFVTLSPNPHWKGKQPYFKDIVIKAIPDTQALQANLLSGGVDYIPGELGMELDQALQFKKRFSKRFNVVIRPASLYEHLDVQLQDEHLQDIRVRQALLYALDRELLNKRLFEGSQPVANSSVSILDATFADDTPGYSYDPEKAKALLKEAGYKLVNGVQMKDGKPLEIEFMTTAGNKTRELVQQFAQGQWKQVGIQAVINNQTARVFFGSTLTERKHKGLAMFAWSTAPEHLPRTTLHSDFIPTEENSWYGQNYAAYSNAEMDRLIDQIDVELDVEKRKALWKKLQHIYATELPAIPLYFRSDAYVMPNWLQGVEPTGHMVHSSNWVENWARVK